MSSIHPSRPLRVFILHPYSVPLVGEFSAAGGSTAVREGLIVRLGAEGVEGVGEIAPLPSYDGTTLADCQRLLDKIGPRLQGVELGDIALLLDEYQGERGWAAVSCGLDVAGLDLMGKLQGVPVSKLLADEVQAGIPVNATVGLADNDAAARQAAGYIEAGFECVKLKVGLGQTLADEVERVAIVRDAIGSEAILRIDANQAWTVEQAINILDALNRFDVDLCEQPVAAHDIAGLAQVRQAAFIAIAADEAVKDLATARAVIEQAAADVLIIKPMAVGGLRIARQIIELAEAAGLGVIVTSMLASGIDIVAGLHLAATITPPLLPQGLATAHLLTDTLIDLPLTPTNGTLSVPTAAGLGIRMKDEG